MVTMGLFGFGAWGTNLARILASSSGGPEFVCDPSAVRRQAATSLYPQCRVHSDWRDALREPVDAVVIASPSDQHYTLALEALRAGKHVLVEKPLALAADEAELLVEESAARGLRLMVDHTYLFSPAVGAMAALIAEGTIGRVVSARSERLNRGGVRVDAPVHWDLATHDLAILQHLLGGRPDAVAAREMAGGNAAGLWLRYPNGVKAEIEVSWVADEKRRLVEITGTEGFLRFDDMEAERKLRVGTVADGREWFVELERREPLREMMQQFARAVETGVAGVSGADSALGVIEALEAADGSLAQGGGEVEVMLRRAAA